MAEAPAIGADLVMDATGRASQSPQWLEAIGYPKPAEERLEIALGYTTRIFRRQASDLDGDLSVVIPQASGGKRGGVILAQEGDRWTVTLFSHFGEYPPTELNGFIEYSKTLPAPYIYEVVRHAEPLCDGAMMRFPASVRRLYERLGRFPAGFLVIGDAISSFNPIYGQGMSCAALQAMELRKVLTRGTGNLAHRFFAKAAKVVDTPWSLVVANDLRMPETKGPRNVAKSLINWYISKLHRAAHRDPAATEAFLRVSNLLAPPPSVLHPSIVMRVLRGNLFPAKLPVRAGRPVASVYLPHTGDNDCSSG